MMFKDIITAKEIFENPPAPLIWVVDSLITEGVTIVAGAPKLGKSYFTLQMATDITMGNSFCGAFPTRQGEVLYLALEDNARRVYDRMCKQSIYIAEKSERLNFIFAIDPSTIVRDLEEFLVLKPNVKCIFIDTLEKIRMARSGNHAYSEDYGFVGPFNILGLKYHVAVVFVHHTRKAPSEIINDTITGTRGITGAADSPLVLARSSDSKYYAELYTSGRDVGELRFGLVTDRDTYCYSLLDKLDTQGHGMSSRKKEIISLLTTSIPLGPKEIAEGITHNGDFTTHYDNIRKDLGGLIRGGEIIKVDRGKYSVPVKMLEGVEPAP